MDIKINGGDYEACAGGGVKTVGGIEELAQRVTMKLTAKRGHFWPKPDYGSRLYMLTGSERPSDRESAVRQYVAEALRDEVGVRLRSVEISTEDRDRLCLRLAFEYTGETFSVETFI